MVESRWRALYKAALLELDPKQLQARVQAAMDAIHARANDAGAWRQGGGDGMNAMCHCEERSDEASSLCANNPTEIASLRSQ